MVRATSEEFLHLGHLFAGEEGTTLLYSGGNFSSSKYSYLCLFPSERVVIQQNSLAPWKTLKSQLSLDGKECSVPSWVGYLSYELGSFSDTKLIPHHPLPIPLAIFYKPSIILCYDHEKQQITGNADIEKLLKKSKEISSHDHFQVSCIAQESKESYLRNIQIAKEHILNGNIYQVNLSHQLLFKGEICPFSYFEKIMRLNPAPFSAFVNSGNFSLICSSPERFLRKNGNYLMTTPIKGTYPRGKTANEDFKNILALKSSPKEQAELLMITDLLRNDLGKISLPGSVKVQEMHKLETYQNVFHLSSTITAESEHHPLDILKAVFPGGSISGCPKLKALEIIYELEKRPRHIYTGSIGYITNKGDFDFNIAIRTCLYQDFILDIQLGAGIVADSCPQSEYQETHAKGASLLGALDLNL